MFHIENWKNSFRDTIILGPVIGLVAFFIPESIGFSAIYFIPQLMVILVLSSAHGPISALSFLLPLFALGYIFEYVLNLVFQGNRTEIAEFIDLILTKGSISIPLGIFTSFLAGSMSSQQRIAIKNILSHLRSAVQYSWRNKRRSEALEIVNLELERRVSAQADSITLLHGQLAKFESTSFRKGLNSLLETVHLFSGMEKGSIWEYVADSNTLVRLADYGWTEYDQEFNQLAIDTSIEGWVYRNSRIFSLKMLLEIDTLKKLDKGHSILTYPIMLGKKTWGILNIESLPFERYSSYTENVVDIIIQLASPGLSAALQNELLFGTAEVDKVTGLPLYSQYYSILEKEIDRTNREGGNLSSVVFELSNITKLNREFRKDGIKSLLLQLKAIIEALGNPRTQFFHYKTDTQIALIVPNVDFDGASLFALETLGTINEQSWEIDGKQVQLEFIIGYSATRGEKSSAAQIVTQIDSLLEMQKV